MLSPKLTCVALRPEYLEFVQFVLERGESPARYLITVCSALPLAACEHLGRLLQRLRSGRLLPRVLKRIGRYPYRFLMTLVPSKLPFVVSGLSEDKVKRNFNRLLVLAKSTTRISDPTAEKEKRTRAASGLLRREKALYFKTLARPGKRLEKESTLRYSRLVSLCFEKISWRGEYETL